MKQMKMQSSFHTMKCSVKTGFTLWLWLFLSSHVRCEDEDIEDEFGGVNIKVFRGPSRIIGNQTFAPFGYHVKMPSAHSSKNYEKKEGNDNEDKVNLKGFDFSSNEKDSQESFNFSNEENEDEPFEITSKEKEGDELFTGKKQNLNDEEFDFPSKEEQEEEQFDFSAENKYSDSFDNSESREDEPFRRSWNDYRPRQISYRRQNMF